MAEKALLKRKWVWGVAIVAVVALGVAKRPQPLSQDMALVGTHDIIASVHNEGKTRIDEIYQITAPVTAHVLRVEGEPGDAVMAQESVLVRLRPVDATPLDPRSYEQASARVKSAEESLKISRADQQSRQSVYDQAARELKRINALENDQVVSERSREMAKTNELTAKAGLDAAIANVRRAEHDLSMAKAALSSRSTDHAGQGIEIKSPISGKILRLYHESEGVVQSGSRLMDVGDPRDLEIVADMLSLDAVKIKTGAHVVIDHWGGDHPLNGVVKVVEPSGFTKYSALGVEEQRVNVIIDITDPYETWRTLGDAFRVEVYVEVDRRDSALAIPVSALYRSQDQWQAYRVADDGTVEVAALSIGLMNDQYAEVLNGLAAGDRVITHPSNKVKAGIQVEER